MTEAEETERLAAESVRYALGHQACPSCGTGLGTCCRCRGGVELQAQGMTVDMVELLRGEPGTPERWHLWCPGCLGAYASDLEALRRDIRARGPSAHELEVLHRYPGLRGRGVLPRGVP